MATDITNFYDGEFHKVGAFKKEVKLTAPIVWHSSVAKPVSSSGATEPVSNNTTPYDRVGPAYMPKDGRLVVQEVTLSMIVDPFTGLGFMDPKAKPNGSLVSQLDTNQVCVLSSLSWDGSDGTVQCECV